MRINRNIAANYGSRLWAGMSTFIFVPVYLHILGPEAFGLVTFSASLLGIIFILDMGMSSAFAREMARETDAQRLAVLLRSLEWVYLGVLLLIIALAFGSAPLIAGHWLNASSLAPGQVRWSVGLMLVSSALQVMMALYIGGLLGSGRHVAAAGFQIGFGLVRSGLVLIPLYFWPVVEFVFVWQLLVSLLALAMVRRTIWRALGDSVRPAFSRTALRAIGGFAGGMFAIALISTINIQSDKLIVSKVFTLQEFGFYSIASLVGQIPSMLVLPLAVTVLPRLTALVSQGKRVELVRVYMQYSMMIAAIAFAATLGVVMGAEQILTLIKGGEPPPVLVNVCRVLAFGGGFLALQFMPYHLAVASGHTRTNIIFGAVSALLLPAAIWAGTQRFGLPGAAWPWLAANAIATIVLAWRITPEFLGPHLTKWTLTTIALPFVISIVVICPSALVLGNLNGVLAPLAVLAISCAVAVAINSFLLFWLFGDRTTEAVPVSIGVDR